eukprot:CAMPEP_0113948362 /NCGR_PEP_ID=MMETSP1339-20121228/69967_1 /TAXON_ID=94617 /ORGANISM="Fibrocapsa japonica" /LENGTH=81 /DNA_ID=CAMNT_0000955401 /DNA_START=24 /DNA_END=265 /DNA_ORIENTATION=- /assembly_acc=CAM_ASM_000762
MNAHGSALMACSHFRALSLPLATFPSPMNRVMCTRLSCGLASEFRYGGRWKNQPSPAAKWYLGRTRAATVAGPWVPLALRL